MDCAHSRKGRGYALAETFSNPETFRHVMGMIREVLCIIMTTGASFGMPMETNLEFLDSDPDVLNIFSVN